MLTEKFEFIRLNGDKLILANAGHLFFFVCLKLKKTKVTVPTMREEEAAYFFLWLSR
jgi:hypothetical protein